MSKYAKALIATALFILTVTALCMPVTAADASHHHRIANGDVCLDCGEQVYECPKCGTIFDISEKRCPFCNKKREAVTQEEKQVNAIKVARVEAANFWTAIAFLVITNLVYLILSLKNKDNRVVFALNLLFFLLLF